MPLLTLFLQSEYYRFLTAEEIGRKVSNMRQPDIVFCGDSITAGGRVWWVRLGRAPFSALNYGASGQETRQIRSQLDRAIEGRARCVVVMAGTNDLFNVRISDEDILTDWAQIFATAQKASLRLIAISLPIQSDTSLDPRIHRINDGIAAMAAKHGSEFIDLNTRFAGHSRADLLSDGVHFSELAYSLWVDELQKVLR